MKLADCSPGLRADTGTEATSGRSGSAPDAVSVRRSAITAASTHEDQHRGQGHGPKRETDQEEDSTLLMDATMKSDMPPLALRIAVTDLRSAAAPLPDLSRWESPGGS